MRTIMLVEDDKDTRDAIGELLRLEGYIVIDAHDGKDAQAQMRQERPDLIILDLFMPVMDGLTFCSVLSADPDFGRIPVVIVSAACRVGEQAEAHRVAGYLQKPIDMEALLQMAQQHCEVGTKGTAEDEAADPPPVWSSPTCRCL